VVKSQRAIVVLPVTATGMTRQGTQMRALFVAISCLVALATVTAARADELDELLAAEPVRVELEPLSTAANRAPIVMHDPSDATADVNDHDRTDADDSSQRPAASSPFSAVPEPSTVAIAGLALLYFMLFGRRRRVV
jgi:PEP-CTERM motif-containing protein